jgi:hypothetical protein
MIRLVIALLSILIILEACKSSAKTGGLVRKIGPWQVRPENIVYWAYHEDTVLPCQFILLSDNRFLYTFSYPKGSDGHNEVHSYWGKAKNTADTIYLKYKGKQPQETTTSYLVKEISGSYLIQYFRDDSSRRMFFRCLKRDGRHSDMF